MNDEPQQSVAVISDIHGNAYALDAVLKEPAIAGADIVVVGGDHAAGPQPREALDQLRSLGDRALLLRGNADREMVHSSEGRAVEGVPDVSVWAASRLSPDDVALLDGLPHPVILSVAGFGQVLFCHGSPRHEDDVVLVDTRVGRWEEVFVGLDPEITTVVGGHTHMPFMRLANGRVFLNPGSVGMPYGRPGASWLVLSGGAMTFGHTPLDPTEMARDITARSSYPSVGDWVRDYVTHPPSDVEALEAFGPMDGRPT